MNLKPMQAGIILAVATAGIVGWQYWSLTATQRQFDQTNRELDRIREGKASPAAPSPVAADIALADYNRVEVGMSLAQVQEIMGGSGEEASRVEMAGVPATFTQRWMNADGGNVIVVIQGDKVMSKAQAGLR